MKKAVAIVATIAFLASASVASAHGRRSSSDINITTNNSATVTNTVTTRANTGGNDSTGGAASVLVRGRGNDDNTARGGNAGDIDTGNAMATSLVVNDVNYTNARVDSDCGCRGDIDVTTRNRATVRNNVTTLANSGNNVSEGGDADTDVRSSWWRNRRANRGGNDNNDATGGNTGEIKTGDADSMSDVRNYVNQTEVRVTRSSNN